MLDSVSVKTTWTLLLYLTSAAEGCIGGETVFYPHDRKSATEEIAVSLETGMLLLHKHGDDCLLVSQLTYLLASLLANRSIILNTSQNNYSTKEEKSKKEKSGCSELIYVSGDEGRRNTALVHRHEACRDVSLGARESGMIMHTMER